MTDGVSGSCNPDVPGLSFLSMRSSLIVLAVLMIAAPAAAEHRGAGKRGAVKRGKAKPKPVDVTAAIASGDPDRDRVRDLQPDRGRVAARREVISSSSAAASATPSRCMRAWFCSATSSATSRGAATCLPAISAS